jgi:hypothetical protein
VYTIGKHNIPKDMMQKVRNQYILGVPYHEDSVEKQLEEEQVRAEAKQEFETKLNGLRQSQDAFAKAILQSNVREETKASLKPLLNQ